MSTFRNNPRFGTRDPEEMERLIKLMRDKAEELGRRPKKTDMNSKDLGPIKKCFGKWCYALEASGLQKPSPETIERRKNKMKKWDRKHAAAKERRSAKYKTSKDAISAPAKSAAKQAEKPARPAPHKPEEGQ